jgi:hypothetical protein
MARNLFNSVHYADVCKECLLLAQFGRESEILENLGRLIETLGTHTVAVGSDCTDASEVVPVRFEIDYASASLL